MPENARQHLPRPDPLVPSAPNEATLGATCLDVSGVPPRQEGGRAPTPGSWTSRGTRRETERDGNCDNRRPCRAAQAPRQGSRPRHPATGCQANTGAAEEQTRSWQVALGRRGIQVDGEF